MSRVGTTNTYESCVNFENGDLGGGPRFKIDPQGGWGNDVVPAQDFKVTAGWVKIYFDSVTKVISVRQDLPENCATTAANYHLRGTFNSWAEGTLMTRLGTSEVYESCQQFTAGTGTPGFKIDPNGAWGNDAFPVTNFQVNPGWVKVTYDGLNKAITVSQNMAAQCGSTEQPTSSSSSVSSSSSSLAISSSSSSVSSSDSSVSSKASSSSNSSAPQQGTVFHLRGTHNNWVEGDLFTPVADSATSLEICRNFAGTVTGGHRFKVDPNGAWGDGFPAADVIANGWTKVVIDGAAKTVTSTETGLSENCGPAAALDDFRARTIYFMFVDRFHNGNTNNDKGTNPVATSTVKAAGNQSEWKKYWGGDIEGIIAKLDYLQALGVGAIWVTPLMDNINVGDEGGYHGYWARDFYEVDEHLGDWALVDELDAQMEARGIKLILDIALNHSNQDDQYEFGALYKEGAFVTDFKSGKDVWYNANGAIADCGDTNPNTKCGTEWDEPWAYRNKSLYNLTDFKHGTTSNSNADNYLINAALKWMDHGVDAFRIDAIKHIEPSFINRFSEAVRAKKADTYIFGEWYNAGAGEPVSMAFLNERRGSELLDFKLRDSIEGAIAGNITMTSLSNHIKSRAPAMNNYEDLQTIFLDNHDATRTSVYLQTSAKTNRGEGKGMSKEFANARQNMGMALVMTLPGIPTIYYGTEQNSTAFTANKDGEMGHDPYNREEMPSFNTNTPAFKLISTLSALRQESPAIQRGTYSERWSTEDVLVFQRQEGEDCAVVAVNRGSATTITVPSLCLRNSAYTSKIGTDVVNVTNGSAILNLSQNEVIVLH